MNFSPDDIAAIIGAKELEIISLRKKLMELQEKIKALEKPEE